MATLHIVRGLPGSGKSTFAKQLANQLSCKHFETDQYFTDENGVYRWDEKKLAAAHEWCRNACLDEIMNGNSVVVSNTFVLPEHIIPYTEVDDQILNAFLRLVNFPIIIYEMTQQYGNTHNVPLNTISKMMSHWKSNSDLSKLYWRNPVTFRSIK